MRKTSLVFVLALFCLAMPALAVEVAAGAAAEPVAAEPAAAAPLADDDFDLAALFAPEPELMTGCYAEKTNCGDGTSVDCNGNTSCSVISSGVICDGNTYHCPNYCHIQEQCYCGGTLQCSSNVGACSSPGDDMVTCDGQTYECPNFCLN